MYINRQTHIYIDSGFVGISHIHIYLDTETRRYSYKIMSL